MWRAAAAEDGCDLLTAKRRNMKLLLSQPTPSQINPSSTPINLDLLSLSLSTHKLPFFLKKKKSLTSLPPPSPVSKHTTEEAELEPALIDGSPPLPPTPTPTPTSRALLQIHLLPEQTSILPSSPLYARTRAKKKFFVCPL